MQENNNNDIQKRKLEEYDYIDTYLYLATKFEVKISRIRNDVSTFSYETS